jgi:hypothetical protein
MKIEWLAVLCCLMAGLPAVLFLRNLPLYRRAPQPRPGAGTPAVSVLIPARNEEESIRGAVESVLASQGVEVEVIVLDDHSTDKTGQIVLGMAMKDDRINIEAAPALPPGWCGKQHACAALAKHASHPILVFMDADVRLSRDGLARMTAFLEKSRAALISGIPRQKTGTLLERLVIPLTHFVLLGLVSLDGMRNTRKPNYSAGCGQLMMVRRDLYFKMGGHTAIRESLHEGIKLPRAFRFVGLSTDLFDATDVATCRLYQSGGDLWRGLSKNATEGLGSPAVIVPATALLLLGQVLPVVLLWLAYIHVLSQVVLQFSIAATVLAYLPRFLGMVRFRQSFIGALLHPLGVLIFLALHWHAFARMVLGKPADWKGRVYAPVAARS